MFREMRRKDRTMDEDKTLSLLKSGEYGIVSMVSVDGYGYGVPVNYVYFNQAVYFHCAVEGSKLNNLRANNKVTFCIVGAVELVPHEFTTKFESAIAFGRAIEVEGKEKEDAFIALVDKFSHDHMEKGMGQISKFIDRTCVIKIEIEHMTGKRKGDN